MHEELLKALFTELVDEPDLKEVHFIYDESKESAEITINTLDGQQLTMIRGKKQEWVSCLKLVHLWKDFVLDVIENIY